MIWLMLYVVGGLAVLEYLLHYGLQQPEARTGKVLTACVLGALWPLFVVISVSVFIVMFFATLIGELLTREKADK
jgi:hypothetical protein